MCVCVCVCVCVEGAVQVGGIEGGPGCQGPVVKKAG